MNKSVQNLCYSKVQKESGFLHSYLKELCHGISQIFGLNCSEISGRQLN